MDLINGVSKFVVFIGVLIVFAAINTVVYFGYEHFSYIFGLPRLGWMDIMLLLVLYNTINLKIFSFLNIFFPIVKIEDVDEDEY